MSPRLRKILRGLNSPWGFSTIVAACFSAWLGMIACGVQLVVAVVLTHILTVAVCTLTDLLAILGKPPAGREACISCNNEYVPTNNYRFCPACRVRLELK